MDRDKMPSPKARRKAKMLDVLEGRRRYCAGCAFLYLMEGEGGTWLGCAIDQNPDLPAPYLGSVRLSVFPPTANPPCHDPWYPSLFKGYTRISRGGQVFGHSRRRVDWLAMQNAQKYFDFSGSCPKPKNPGPANS